MPCYDCPPVLRSDCLECCSLCTVQPRGICVLESIVWVPIFVSEKNTGESEYFRKEVC